MAQDNKHKFHEKLGGLEKGENPVVCFDESNSLNYSRTLGSSNHWLGCGYMHKDGKVDDHIRLNFPFYSLVYVVDGEGRFVDAEDVSYALSAGAFFQRQPGIVHSSHVKPGSGWKEYYLDCDKGLYQQLVSMSLINAEVSVYKRPFDQGLTNEIESLLKILKHSSQDQIYDAYLQFQQILRLMFGGQSDALVVDSMIEQSLRDFDRAYAQRFDLKAYCSSKGWGYEKFRKVFRKHTGVSPRDYLVRRRMDEACRLLRSTRRKISDISQELGYSSQYEFSNQFKKFFKVFPKHYRDGL